jgi:hypothetical protein
MSEGKRSGAERKKEIEQGGEEEYVQMKGIDSKFCFQNYPLSFIELGVSEKLHFQLKSCQRNGTREGKWSGTHKGGEGGRGRVCGAGNRERRNVHGRYCYVLLVLCLQLISFHY